MRRREFITGVGALATRPLAARAQQREQMRRIGVLLPAPADDPVYQVWAGAFLQGLALLGWTIGRNVQIDTRWAGTNAADIPRHAAELVALAPDVILGLWQHQSAPLSLPPRCQDEGGGIFLHGHSVAH
jgi:putative ABC transport system substrate-binding protein